MAALTDVRQISHIAYGFMASKTLFVALNVELFGHLSDGPKRLDALAAATGLAGNRLATLLAALTSLGLLTKSADGYANAPATQRYLVPGEAAYFGGYYRHQIDRQIYPSLVSLEAGVRGDAANLAHDTFRGMLEDPVEAEAFSRAQHAGSLGPALALARAVDLGGCRHLLDVAGGSGAFAITLCQANPHLAASILDFANVIEVAKRTTAAAGMADRIALIVGDALETDWPAEQDVVLLSYLLSAVAGTDIPGLFERAWRALAPGGRLIIHDFMLDDDRAGPTSAALWFLQYLSVRTDSTSFSAAELRRTLAAQGFTDIAAAVLIPEITKYISARKPDSELDVKS